MRQVREIQKVKNLPRVPPRAAFRLCDLSHRERQGPEGPGEGVNSAQTPEMDACCQACAAGFTGIRPVVLNRGFA